MTDTINRAREQVRQMITNAREGNPDARAMLTQLYTQLVMLAAGMAFLMCRENELDKFFGNLRKHVETELASGKYPMK
jgi:phosphoribosylamine-glycine ligase